jgi:TPP-dependent pyruvate/acetoin dehydrogenase alpha subunit
MRSVDPYGFPSIPVDGSDAVAVYRVAFEALYKARIGAGPTLITCKYDRQSQDPLVHAENYLKKKGLWSDEFATRVVKGFSQELENARKPGLALRG